VTEQLKAKEVVAKAGAGAEGGTRVGDAAQQSEPVEAAPSATGLGRSGGDGQEPGSTTRTLETVEAGEAMTSACDIGQVNAEETRNMVELCDMRGKRRSFQNYGQSGRSRNNNRNSNNRKSGRCSCNQKQSNMS
jgi:hypothetical protein